MVRTPETIKEARAWSAHDERSAELKAELTPVLLDLLIDADEITRTAAGDVLRRRGERVTLDRALALCRHERPEVRETAAYVLGQLGHVIGRPAETLGPYKAASVPILQDMLLTDPAPEVRASAAYALGHLHAESALDSLVRMAADPDPDVRLGVAFALGGLGQEDAIPTLQALVDDPDEDVADWADSGLDWVLGSLFHDEPTSALLDRLDDPEERTRWAAAELLGGRGEPVVMERAMELASDSDEECRRLAAFMFQHLGWGDEQTRAPVVPLVEEMLKDGATAVREQAAMSLGQMRAKESLQCLIEAAADPEADVRVSVAESLRQLRLPAAIPTLEVLAGDADAEVRMWAEYGLEVLRAMAPAE